MTFHKYENGHVKNGNRIKILILNAESSRNIKYFYKLKKTKQECIKFKTCENL